MELIATISTGAQETRKPNSSIRPVAVDRLPADRQAFVLGMVQWNLFPKGIVLKQHPWFGKTRKGFDCLSGAGYSRLEELRSQGHQASVDRGIALARDHWSSWAEKAVAELLAPLTDICLDEAVRLAHVASDETGLPQTVYRDDSSGGWSHTNALANRLGSRKAELMMTVLPARYFA